MSLPTLLPLRRTTAAVALACLLPLAGCSDLPGAGDKGYVSLGGQVVELDPGDRDGAVDIEGDDLDGEQVAVEDFRGKVLVINVWGAWCTDCRKEAPDLVTVADELTGDDVAFLGLNVRDSSTDNAQGYVRTFKVPFRSIYDPGGRTLLAFRGTLTPNSIPSTVVLDREGRVAASILGSIPSATTLRNIVEKVVDEDG